MSQYNIHSIMSQAEVTLNYLSSDELRDLLNDDEKLEARITELVSLVIGWNDSLSSFHVFMSFLSTLKFQLAPLENDKSGILNSNVQAAEESLTKEPELIELRSKVNELSTKSKELCTDIQEKLSQMSK